MFICAKFCRIYSNCRVYIQILLIFKSMLQSLNCMDATSVSTFFHFPSYPLLGSRLGALVVLAEICLGHSVFRALAIFTAFIIQGISRYVLE